MLRDTHDEDDEYFPYVDEDQKLVGVLHRSALKAAPARHTLAWQRRWIALRTQQGAAARAYGAIDRALTRTRQAQAGGEGSPGRDSPPTSPDRREPRSPPGILGHAMRTAASFDRRSARRKRSAEQRQALHTPFGSELQVQIEDINPIELLKEQTLREASQHAGTSAAPAPAPAPAAAAESNGGASASGELPAACESPPGLVPSPMAAPDAAGPNGVGITAPPPPPPSWMGEAVPYQTWRELGLDPAPFTVQSCAPMNLVHFYFSQLTLNCVFVVDKGRFVGIINKADIVRGGY